MSESSSPRIGPAPSSTGAPSANGANGRDARGRFVRGTAGGPGNPWARRVCETRTALHDAAGPEEVREVVRKLVELAKAGDVAAARVVLDRALGPPVALDMLEAEVMRPEDVDEFFRTVIGVLTRYGETGREINDEIMRAVGAAPPRASRAADTLRGGRRKRA